MKFYGFLLLGLGIFAGFMSTLMFGDIMVAGMIGSIALGGSGFGFLLMQVDK